MKFATDGTYLETEPTMKSLRSAIPLALLLIPLTASAAADFHISPSGKDSNPGTEVKPFASLERARNAAREIRAADPNASCRIVLGDGTYRIDRTLVFGLQDGAAGDGITEIVAAPDATPVLSGSAPLPAGWKRATHDLPRLSDQARGKIWVAHVPEDWPAFRTLFQGGTVLPRARSGGFRQLNVSPTGGPAIDKNHLYLPAEAMRGIANFAGAEMVVIPSKPWVLNILPITKVDRPTGMVYSEVPGTYPLGTTHFGNFPDGTVWIENVLETLDEPGEWVLDKQAGKLYLWPKDGKRPGDDVVAPRLTELMRIEGKIDYDGPRDTPVKGIVIRGITFTQSDRWAWRTDKTGWGLQHDWEMFDRPTAMLRFRGAESCRVEDCRFVNSGSAGVRLDLHCQKISVTACELSELGGAGVLLAGYGMGTKDVNRDNAITDCNIHHIGRMLWHSAGIWVWQSGHNTIEHNHIHHTPYTGILVTGRFHMDRRGLGQCSRTVRWDEIDPILGGGKPPGWAQREPFLHGRENYVAYNDLDHCMEKLGDGNAIYVSGTGKDNRIHNNFIHDIPSVNINASIRCDDDQRETIIENNVITRVCGEGFTWKGKNTIRNNIAYDIRDSTPDGAPCVHQRGYLVIPAYPVDGSIVRRNIIVSKIPGQNLLFERVNPPKARPLSEPVVLRTCAADFNIYFNTAEPGWGEKHIEAQRQFGIEEHSIEASPMFVDPENDNFRLSDGSPALKLGFRPIDISQVGPRKPGKPGDGSPVRTPGDQ